MADEDDRLAKENAAETFEPVRDYKDFSAPGFIQSGDVATPAYRELGVLEAAEDREQARLNALRIMERERERAETAWERDFSFGPVVKPVHNTLQAYKRELRQGANGGSDESRDISFNGRKYGVFDARIIHEVGVDAQSNSLSPAFNDNHPQYDNYAPLRRNLAILRDYLATLQFPDAEFQKGVLEAGHKEDKWNLNKLEDMATALGKELGGVWKRPTLVQRWAKSVGRIFSGQDMTKPNTSAFLEAANVPDKGIAVMYNYLLEKQSKATLLDAAMVQLTPQKWGLPPIKQTPFSKENMELYSRSKAMEDIANALDGITVNVRSVDSLSVQDKAVSVEEARKILENLRIKMGSNRESTSLNMADPRRKEAAGLLGAAIALQDSLAALVKIDPTILTNPFIMQARDALEHANYQVTLQAAKMLQKEGNIEAAQAMFARAEEMPEKAKTPMSTTEVMTRLETGLSVAGTMENKYQARLSELRASRANQTNQQNLARQQQRTAAQNNAKKVLAQKEQQQRQHSVDDGRMYSGRVAGASTQGIADAARHVNDNLNAPYLTPKGREI